MPTISRGNCRHCHKDARRYSYQLCSACFGSHEIRTLHREQLGADRKSKGAELREPNIPVYAALATAGKPLFAKEKRS